MAELKKVKVACQDCGRTGLYVGELTKQGTATICLTCGGKGYIDAEYEPFTKRAKKSGIKKVFVSAFGCEIFATGQATYELEDGTITVVDFDKYNCTYKDWFNGDKSPILLEELTCPLIASNQSLDIATELKCAEKSELDTPIGCWACYKTRELCWAEINK